MRQNLFDWCHNNNRVDLLEEWHPIRNKDSTPLMVNRGTNKKAWWICSKCGHEWESTISNRTKNHGCPKCAKKRLSTIFSTPGKNKSLEDLYPNVAKEWHPTKNNGITPSMVNSGTHKKVWWICSKCGHEWESTISNRTRNHGCPKCAKKSAAQKCSMPKQGKSLKDLYPDIAKEWHPKKNIELYPSIVNSGSNKKVWWLCPKCGNEWKTAISYRVNGNGCPECAKGLKISFPEKAIFYYIKKEFPAALDNVKSDKLPWINKSELDIYIPELALAIEYDGSWHQNVDVDIKKNVLCKNNNTIIIRIREASIPILNDNGSINYILKNRSTNELERAIEFIFNKIDTKLKADININRDRGNIYTIMDLKGRKELSLESVYPDISAQWHPTKNGTLSTLTVMPGSNKRVWWLCSDCGYEWETTVSNRTNGYGCPKCATRRVAKLNSTPSIGESLEDFRPDISAQWHPTKNGTLTPQGVAIKSGKEVWWLCEKCNNEWKAQVYSRVEGRGCPYCSNQKVKKGFNDLALKRPDIAIQWHPTKNGTLTPEDVTQCSGKRVWWYCNDCGHEWESTIANRTNGNGCPVCRKEKLSKICSRPKNGQSLAEKRPDIVIQWHPTNNGEITPFNVTYGSGKKVWWLCNECGNEWESTVSNRTTLGRGCPSCSKNKSKLKR